MASPSPDTTGNTRRPRGHEDHGLPLLQVGSSVEYTSIGSSLSEDRQDDAESGSQHRTARALVSLLDTEIPPIPNLIARYGTRVSEILRNVDVNPSGDAQRHGPFAAFVGADATSIWAAATVKGKAIAVHLLACLLARAFNDPSHSTSIWMELVSCCQMKAAESHKEQNENPSQLGPATQPITRDDLQKWDASARAWIQSADLAMRDEQTQIRLVFSSMDLPVDNSGHFYGDIVQPWREALVGLEKLLDGQPLSVSDGVLPLAISAWHLYPNLVILGSQVTQVDFEDALIPSSSALAIETTKSYDLFTSVDEDTTARGIRWPVTVSQLGPSAESVQIIGRISDRIYMEDLHLIALGSLLATWKAKPSEIEPSFSWFVALWDCVNSAKASLPKLKWLEIIALAAERILQSKGQLKKGYLYLVDFGYRRGRNFLVPSSEASNSLPWFGLRFEHILHSLGGTEPGNCGRRYLRQLAKVMGLRHNEALITQISSPFSGIEKKQLHQYSTAVPLPLGDGFDEGDDISEDSDDEENTRDEPSSPSTKGKGKAAAKPKPSKFLGKPEGPSYHRYWTGCFIMYDCYTARSELESFALSQYRNAISAPVSLPLPIRCDRVTEGGSSPFADCQAFLSKSLDLFPNTPVILSKVLGDSTGTLRLWIVQEKAEDVPSMEESVKTLRTTGGGELVDLETATKLLSDRAVWPYSLWQYLEGPDPYEPDPFINPFLELVRTERRLCEPIITSLKSLNLANSIYKGLHGASISSAVVEHGIHQAKWAEMYHSNLTLTRPLVFSCIAMFETGYINVEVEKLDQVYTLSSGNSIFVTPKLLNDPNAQVSDYDIVRVVGNLNRPGISFLVFPTAPPPIKSLSGPSSVVSYETFDGRCQNCFKDTSLKLRFTGHKFPLDIENGEVHNQQAQFVESTIAVHDAGDWVTDLDVSTILNWDVDKYRLSPGRGPCTTHSKSAITVLENFVSVDSWAEVIESPPSVGLVRAYKSWPARLAISAMLMRQNTGDDTKEVPSGDGSKKQKAERIKPVFIILDSKDDICWACVYRRLKRRVQLDSEAPAYLIV